MSDINNQNYKVLKKVILPFFEKFKDAGLINGKDIKRFKKRVSNNTDFGNIWMSPFNIYMDYITLDDQPVIRYHKFYDNIGSLKFKLPSIIFSELAKECDITIRDIFLSYISIIAYNKDIDLGFLDGLIKLGDGTSILLTVDTNGMLEQEKLGEKRFVAIIFKGKRHYDLEVSEVFKFKNIDDMESVIKDISSKF